MQTASILLSLHPWMSPSLSSNPHTSRQRPHQGVSAHQCDALLDQNDLLGRWMGRHLVKVEVIVDISLLRERCSIEKQFVQPSDQSPCRVDRLERIMIGVLADRMHHEQQMGSLQTALSVLVSRKRRRCQQRQSMVDSTRRPCAAQ